MSGLINVTFPSLLWIAYKRKRRRREKRLGKFILRILCQTVDFQYQKKKVNVAYYSDGGPNHSKLSVLTILLLDSSHFIAASQSRGTDHGVGSKSTPTVV